MLNKINIICTCSKEIEILLFFNYIIVDILSTEVGVLLRKALCIVLYTGRGIHVFPIH